MVAFQNKIRAENGLSPETGLIVLKSESALLMEAKERIKELEALIEKKDKDHEEELKIERHRREEVEARLWRALANTRGLGIGAGEVQDELERATEEAEKARRDPCARGFCFGNRF